MDTIRILTFNPNSTPYDFASPSYRSNEGAPNTSGPAALQGES